MPVTAVTPQVGPATSWHQPKARSNPWFAPDARYVYIVQRTDTGDARIHAAYDAYEKFVVVARDSKVARQLAQAMIADERNVDPNFWLNTVYSSCHKVGLARKPNGQSPAREKVLAAEGRFH